MDCNLTWSNFLLFFSKLLQEIYAVCLLIKLKYRHEKEKDYGVNLIVNCGQIIWLVAHWLLVPGDNDSNPGGGEKKFQCRIWVVISSLLFTFELIHDNAKWSIIVLYLKVHQAKEVWLIKKKWKWKCSFFQQAIIIIIIYSNYLSEETLL